MQSETFAMLRTSARFALAALLSLWITAGVASATTIRYEYDALQRLVRVTYDNGTRISYSYDAAGNMVSRVGTLAPPQLSYTTAGLELVVNWTTVPGATGYTLHYAPAPYAGPATIGSMDMGSSTTFSINLWEGATYFIAVTAYNGDGESGYSNIDQFTINTQIPPQVPQFSYRVSGTSIVMSWDAVPRASGYRLSYMTKAYTHPGDFSVEELGSATSFSYDQLQVGGTYTIALQAYNAWGASDYSRIETFTVPAAAASGVEELTGATSSSYSPLQQSGTHTIARQVDNAKGASGHSSVKTSTVLAPSDTDDDGDGDGDGYSKKQGDCDDSNPLLWPYPVSVGKGGHLLTGVPGQSLAASVAVQGPAGAAYSYELLTSPPGMVVDFVGTLSYTVPTGAAQGDSAPFLVRVTPLAGGCDSMLAGTLHVVGTVANETSRTVGSHGDIVSDSQGLVSITVPPGFLTHASELRIAPLTSLPAGVFSGLGPLALYDVALGTDHTFAAPLTLSFAYDEGWYDANLNNGGLIVAGWNDQLGWFTPPQRIDAQRLVVEVDSQHLGPWGLFRLSGFAAEPSPQGSFAVYYQPGATPPRLLEFPNGYTMLELAKDVGGWADTILKDYQSAGFGMPQSPQHIVLTDRVAGTQWEPKSGYVYLQLPGLGSLEELKHDLAQKIFHTLQNNYDVNRHRNR